MKPIRIGFTGSQSDPTVQQLDSFSRLLSELFQPGSEFHHGDCIGSDSAAHDCAREYRIVVHPPTNPAKRAFRIGDEIHIELPYLVRNRNIVDQTELLIAMPSTTYERLRSGTWSTVRYARKQNRIIIKIFPDGQVELEDESAIS